MTFIVGIDPGRQHTGICVFCTVDKKVVYNGTFNMSLANARKGTAFNPSWYRLRELQKFIIGELEPYVDISFCVIEDYVYLGKKMTKEDYETMDRSPLQLAETHGAIYSAISTLLIPTFKISPTMMKFFITGDGTADKRLIIKKVYAAYDNPLDDEHQFDALVMCHVGRYLLVFASHPGRIKEGTYEYTALNSILMDNRHKGVARAILARGTDNVPW